jgi:hypothetical protein
MISTAEQTSAVNPKTTADHNIVIVLKNKYAARRDPMPVLHFGETVQYTTTEPGAEASMVFPDLSPYRTDDQKVTEIFDSQITELVRPFKDGEATFTGRCYLTIGGAKIGWDPADPDSGGGVHRVQKP